MTAPESRWCGAVPPGQSGPRCVRPPHRGGLHEAADLDFTSWPAHQPAAEFLPPVIGTADIPPAAPAVPVGYAVHVGDDLEVTDYDQDGDVWSTVALDGPARVLLVIGTAEQADQLVKAATRIRRRLARAEACEQARSARAEANAAAAAAEEPPVLHAELWVCRGECGRNMIGNRPADDVCHFCAALALAAAPASDPVIPVTPDSGQRYDVVIPDADGPTPVGLNVTGEMANELAAEYEGAEIVPHPDHVSPPSEPEPVPPVLPEGRAGTIALIPAAAHVTPGPVLTLAGHDRLAAFALRQSAAVAGARAHMAGRKVRRRNGTAAYLRAVLAEIDRAAGAA